MKKSLVLAMAMTLGVTASAYAANPFSDVPAGHWAYDSISKLAAAGIIEGYGDDTFRGDRLMTRYEMAQIVAKALAKGANVDRLASEFADELDSLGVRVAALEKKSDNVKITGEIRYHWAEATGRPLGARQVETGLRSRLWFNGQINDNWKYVGRIQNEQDFRDDNGNEQTRFNVAKVEGRLGGVNVVAGRDDDVFAEGYIYDGAHDALKLSYGDKWYVSGAYGKLTDANDNSRWDFDLDGNGDSVAKKFFNVETGTQMDGRLNGKIGYFKMDSSTLVKRNLNVKDVGVWYAGLDFGITDDLALNAMYLKSNRDRLGGANIDDDGFVVGLGYKGADEAEPGSWGLHANYYDQGGTTYVPECHTIDGYTSFDSGFKGWSVGGDVTLAKNMVFSATYYQTKAKNSAIDGGGKAKVAWTELDITF